MMHGERLLLVEDDAATREVLTLLLAGAGWAVEAVESGEEALGRMVQVAPAMVLCDLHLPGVCGEELARGLREGMGDGVVLVAMTASVRAGSGDGYDAVLGKPFAVEAVELAWRGRGAGRAFGGRAEALPAEVSGSVEDVALDEAVVARLRRQMGDAGVRGFYAFALADAGDRVRRMEAAVAGQDGVLFAREAHAVKGSCGMMGARRLWRLASEAEVDGLGAGSGGKVSRMMEEIELLCRMLETISAI